MKFEWNAFIGISQIPLKCSSLPPPAVLCFIFKICLWYPMDSSRTCCYQTLNSSFLIATLIFILWVNKTTMLDLLLSEFIMSWIIMIKDMITELRKHYEYNWIDKPKHIYNARLVWDNFLWIILERKGQYNTQQLQTIFNDHVLNWIGFGLGYMM